MERWRVRVLGTPGLERLGTPVPLPAIAARVLGALALQRGAVVAADDLIDSVWGHDAPPTARKSLQNQVVRLRATLGNEVIATAPGGYRLEVEAATSDLAELDRLEAIALSDDASPHDALDAATQGIALWSSDDDPGYGWPSAARRAHDRLVDRRGALEERRVSLLMASGHIEMAIEAALELVDRQPFREQAWALLMHALYRAGRRRDALRVYGTARRRFLDEIGIEPGPLLRRVESQVIADDPRLLASPVPPPAAVGARLVRDDTEIFVGRVGELARLAELMARPRSGAHLLDISGEPGIGKTALVGALLRLAAEGDRDTTALIGRCDPFSDQALHPVTEALMSVVPLDLARAAVDADDDRAALAAVVPDLVEGPAAGASDVTRDRVEEAVIRILRHLGRRRRLLVVFEDVHWATPRVAQLIERMLTAQAGDPLVVITRRDTDPVEPAIVSLLARADAAGRLERFELGPLPEEALDAYLADVLPEPIDRSELVAWLLARTDGHPLFLRELVNHLVATDAIATDSGTATLRGDVGPLPDTLRNAIGERIGTLSAATVATLQVVAAAGSSCDIELLRALAGDVTFALHEAERARLIAPREIASGANPSSVMLTHDLVRRYLYDLMPEPRRVEMHERIATSLAALGGQTSEIAHHYRAASSLDAHRALDWTVRAGHEADAVFDHDAAVVQFVAARTLVERGSIIDMELAIAEGAARRRAGDPDHVEFLLSVAEEARAMGDGSLLAKAVIEVGDLGGATHAGSTDERVRPLLEDALLLVSDPVLLARLRAAVSVFFSLSEQWPRVRELWESAAETAEALADDRLLLAVYCSADHGTGAPSQLARRREVSTRLAEVAARLHDAYGSYMSDYLAFTAALQDGSAAEIDMRLEHLERFDRDVAHGMKEWTVTFSRAGRTFLAGCLDEAEALNDHALGLGGAMAPSWTFAVYSGILVAIRKEQDRLAELRDNVSALLAAQPGMHAWRAVAAYIAADVGDLDSAASLLADVVDDGQIRLPDDMTWLAAAAMLADVAVRLGDRARAATLAAALSPYTGRTACSGPAVFGAVDTSLGHVALLCGDRARAAAHYASGHELGLQLDAPIIAGEAEVALAALGLHPGQDLRTLSEVQAEAERRGWPRLARRAAAVLASA